MAKAATLYEQAIKAGQREVWRTKHRDFRSGSGDARSVLQYDVLGSRGTILSPLSALAGWEIDYSLNRPLDTYWLGLALADAAAAGKVG